jgi:CubicO group peptidase (beta-lactamase class C family)
VIRRVTGRSLGQFLAEEVTGPLRLDLWVGLPEEHEVRVSRLIPPDPPTFTAEDVKSFPPERIEMLRGMASPTSLTMRALNVTDPPFNFNSRLVHAGEQPAANAITTARALAKLYAATVSEVDGTRLLSPATIEGATQEQSNGSDAVLLIDSRFGSGFFLHSTFSPLLGPASFGHAGAGGSLAFADPDRGVGFGYVMNKMQQNLSGDEPHLDPDRRSQRCNPMRALALRK